MDVGALGGEETFLLVEVLTVNADDALGVEHDDVFLRGSDGHVQFGAGNSRSTGSVNDNLYFADVLAIDFESILQSGCRNDGSAVLVVVHDGDVEGALQAILDIETLRSLDVLEVDTSEGRSDALYCLTEFLRVFFCHLDIEDVNTTIDFEEQTLTLHDGFAAHGTDITKSEYGSTVGDDSYQIALVRVFVCIVGIFLYFQTGVGDTGRVG